MSARRAVEAHSAYTDSCASGAPRPRADSMSCAVAGRVACLCAAGLALVRGKVFRRDQVKEQCHVELLGIVRTACSERSPAGWRASVPPA